MASSGGYYTPYASDSDTGSDISDASDVSDEMSSFDSDDTSEYAAEVVPDVGPNFRALAEGLTYRGIGSPAFDTSGQELFFSHEKIGAPLAYGYPVFDNLTIPKDASGSEALKSTPQNINGIVMLDSRDRDRQVFPQPTSLTLRLPRVYSNVTSFQIVQIKLLSSFFYFRLTKRNTDMTTHEFGRTITNSQGQLVDDLIQTFIRPGSYDINGLMTELTTQLNYTPIFYDFPNGFQDFATRFAATGDFSLNFNFPGDTYYDSLLNQFIANPTMALIVSKYFINQYAGLSSYTTDQIKVAYYYPVVKEALLDASFMAATPLNLDVSTAALLPGETVRSRCIYTFQGLDDTIVQEVIALNVPLLDTYRLQQTFRYFLVNKYDVTLEPQSSRVTISSPSLNTSLLNLLSYKQSQFFAQELAANGLTQDQYNTLVAQNTILLAIVNDMFYYIEQYLATYFGIPFNTYDITYITNPTFTVPIRDATQAVGISSNYDLAVIQRNQKPITQDILAPLRSNAPAYWNRISSVGSTISFPFNLETGSPATSSNYPYSVLLEQQDRDHKFVDASGHMYANQLLRYTDVVLPLDATGYSVFKFKSPVRQTLQVATLPRPTKFRYPAYNAVAYDVSSQTLFDNSYAFVSTVANSNMDVAGITLTPVPGFSAVDSNFAVNYSTSVAAWAGSNVTNFIGNTRSFFSFTAPQPSPTASPGYRYPLSVTMAAKDATSTFVTPMNIFVYHDRGAFMADVSDNRTEKAIHYLTSTTATTDVSSATVTFNAYGGQTYYVLTRTQELAVPTQRYRVVPWFPGGSTFTTLTSSLAGFDPLADPTTPAALSNYNYAALADPAFIRLPIQSTLMPSTVVDPLFTPITFSTVAIGYDTAGVSTDLTHYQGFYPDTPASNVEPKSQIRVDPVNGYLFQAVSPYNSTTQAYFYSTSSNAILTSNGTNVYTPQAVAQRQYTIAHWYSPTYLPNSSNQPPILSNMVPSSAYAAPYTAATTGTALTGYSYGGSNGAIQFGDGVAGMSFVPGQGVWDIQRVMFKSAYTTSNVGSDSNLAIARLGVFYAAEAATKNLGDFTLSKAVAVLKKGRTMVYNGSPDNFGFDSVGGSYYEFVRDTAFNTGSNAYLYGYSQIRGQFNPDIQSAYTLVPFDSAGRPVFYQALAGSAVPYPYYSDAVAAPTYLDGNSTLTGTDLVVPVIKGSPDSNRAPPIGYDQTQSKYEQSMPVGTNLLSYAVKYPFIQMVDAMNAFSPLPYAPSLVVADVSGYIMTQDSYFRVFEYTTSSTSRDLTERYQFTLDQVVDTTNPAIEYIGCAANEASYSFFSYSNDLGTPSNSKIVITTMTPSAGYVQDTRSLQTPFVFSANQLTSLTYNNAGGFTMAIQQGSNVFVYGLATAATATSAATILSNTIPNTTIDYFKVQQSPKELDGRFYVFPVRSGGAIFDYVTVDPTAPIGSANPNYEFAAASGAQAVTIAVYNLSNAPGLNQFISPTVTRQPWEDYLTLMTPQDATHMYRVTGYTASNAPKYTSNAVLTQSAYAFPGSTSNLYPGGNGAIWALRGSALYGNRNDTVDAPRKLNQAWQLFYPVQRIVFTQVAKNFTFMRDLSGLQYAEYPHTCIIGYNSQSTFNADTKDRWGLERATNFNVGDFSFSGEYFNGSVVSFPLQKTTGSDSYYLAIRNYSPTEKSQVLLRCSLNNRYDFGYVTMTDISNEVITAATGSNQFDPDYYTQLLGFNSNFIIGPGGRFFGANMVQGFTGSNISSVTGFGDFYNRFRALYSQYNTQVQLVQTINSNVQQAMSNFIATDLHYILPSNVLNRQRFTDPLSFSIKWKSSLFPQYAKLEEEWGLGWNLGFAKADTPYDTVQQADSFFKILDDFINLRLNPEFDMNRMDTSLKEKLSATLEPTGATKAFHAKLLLANFGSYAQTLISNPLSFSPPIGRMDKLTFNWVDVTGATIDNADCEWNMVVQLVEQKDMTEFGQPPRVANLGQS